MILSDKDIKFCKELTKKLGLKAVLNNDEEVIAYSAMLLQIIGFYESHMNSWEYNSHHDRQATAFIKRLAIMKGKFDNMYSVDFEDLFLGLINDYPAIKQRFNEWLKDGDV